MAKEKVGEVTLAEDIFNRPVQTHLLHRAVTMQLANRRAGTSSTKGRSEVRGGGRKPHRQKGSGRARAGTSTSPLMRKGGVVFGPQPRVIEVKMPKKLKRLALKMALSSKWQSDHLLVLDEYRLEEIKTKPFCSFLDRFALKKVLIVTEQENETLEKSARNVPTVKVLRVEGLNTYDVLKFDHLVLNQPTVTRIEEALGS
jgi:large subunit ribosomal protein L4